MARADPKVKFPDLPGNIKVADIKNGIKGQKKKHLSFQGTQQFIKSKFATAIALLGWKLFNIKENNAENGYFTLLAKYNDAPKFVEMTGFTKTEKKILTNKNNKILHDMKNFGVRLRSNYKQTNNDFNINGFIKHVHEQRKISIKDWPLGIYQKYVKNLTKKTIIARLKKPLECKRYY